MTRPGLQRVFSCLCQLKGKSEQLLQHEARDDLRVPRLSAIDDDAVLTPPKQAFSLFSDDYEVDILGPWIGEPQRHTWNCPDGTNAGDETEMLAQFYLRRNFSTALLRISGQPQAPNRITLASSDLRSVSSGRSLPCPR